MDENCVKILTIMILNKPNTHYNELHRELKKKHMEISKPTLTVHLNHLINQGFICKEESKNTQFVTYRLNDQNTGQIKEVAKRTKLLLKTYRESEEEFYSLSEGEQIELVLATEIRRKAEEIKALIDYKLHPDKMEKIIYANFLDSPMLHIGQKWIIKKSLEDALYRKKIIELLDKWQEKF